LKDVDADGVDVRMFFSVTVTDVLCGTDCWLLQNQKKN